MSTGTRARSRLIQAEHKAPELAQELRAGKKTIRAAEKEAKLKALLRLSNEYKLIPAAWINGSLVPFVDLSIRKREIFFRHKSEITPGDEDAVVLREK